MDAEDDNTILLSHHELSSEMYGAAIGGEDHSLVPGHFSALLKPWRT